MRGQASGIRKLLAAFASGGHVLLEDLPGTGKTTLAKAFARALAADFQRIQFTPDMLPADILGVSVFESAGQGFFRLHRGPVFTEILLADEINRASPRTQSALLEAMGEGQVSLEGVRHDLPPLFFVIATQNPIEFHGTYPLPEAQMDRFALRFSLGYLSLDEEVLLLTDQREGHPLERLTPCVTREDALVLKAAVPRIHCSEALKQYTVRLTSATRHHTGVQMGASPRASLSLMKAAQALALFDGLDFVTPEHLYEMAVAVIAHRLKLDPQAHFAGLTSEQVVRSVLQEIPVPV